MRPLHITCILLSSFIILSFCSCRKKNKYHTVVKGKVINHGSKAPIEGVEVILQDGVNDPGLMEPGGTSSDKKSVSYTDANGAFSVELKGEHLAYIGMRKEGYVFEYSNGGSVVGIKAYPEGIHENQVLEMKAEAFFDGYFQSLTPLSVDTLIADPLSNETLNTTGFKKTFYGVGPHKWRNTPYLVIGDMFLKIKLDYTRNGQWESRIDSVYIKSLETYTDTIYY